MADLQTTEQAAKVPFIGWSRAAARFREQVALYAPGGEASVLLLGPAGAGKRTMAKVWQHVARKSGSRIPIVNLDSSKATKGDHFIGYSTLPLPKHAQCIRLDNGGNHLFSAEPTGVTFISEETVNHFQPSLRFYMPPLRERPMDILALLQFLNQYVLPKHVGGSYHSISETFLEAIIKAPWELNVLDLQSFLLASGREDAHEIGCARTSTLTNLGTLRAANHLHKLGGLSDQRLNPLEVFEAIKRGDLPDTSAWRNKAKDIWPQPLLDEPVLQFDSFQRHAIRMYCRESFLLLSPYKVWLDDPTPTVESFRQFTIAQFVELGMCLQWFERHRKSPLTRWQASTIASDVAAGCDFIKRKIVASTTFPSLQDGFAVNSGEVASIMRPESPKMSKHKKHKNRRRLQLTEKQKAAWTMRHSEKKTIGEIAAETGTGTTNVYKLSALSENFLVTPPV